MDIPWKELGSANLELLDLIHRGHDGMVTFHRLDHANSGKFRGVASLPASELRQWLPGLLPGLIRALDLDGFFSVNGMAYHGRGQSPVYGVPARRPSRKKTNLKYLCACWADLDIRSDDDGYSQDAVDLAVGRIIRLQNERVIPPASVVLFSGRGMWLLWLLDNGKGLPVRASDLGSGKSGNKTSKNATWLACQRRLGELLADLHPDRGAMHDIVRVARVPGTINTKSGERVTYWVPFSEDGIPFTYGIRELASRLGVRSLADGWEQRRPAYQRKPGELPDKAKQHAWRQRWVRVVNVVEGLAELRGGLDVGCRNYAALLLASSLKTLGFGPADVYDRVNQLALRFKGLGKSFQPWEVNQAVKSANDHRGSKFATATRNATVIEWLGMSPDECKALDFHPAKPRIHKNRKLTTEKRRGRLRAILNECIAGPRPSLRELVRRLAEFGIKTNPETVRKDLAALRKSGDIPDGWLFPM